MLSEGNLCCKIILQRQCGNVMNQLEIAPILPQMSNTLSSTRHHGLTILPCVEMHRDRSSTTMRTDGVYQSQGSRWKF